MPKKKRKAYDPNESPVGWYVGSVLEQFRELEGPGKNRKFNTVWENTHLIKARTIEQAYAKLERIGKLSNRPYRNPDGLLVEWRFRGVGELLPIYEALEDGSEIMWCDWGLISEKRLTKKRKVR